MLQLLAFAMACTTVVADPDPPTNVRSSPNGPVLAKLPNGTKLEVDEDHNGWLRVSAPKSGWVHSSVTSVTCGDSSDVHGTVDNIHALGKRALEDRVAADTLIRYAIGADGGFAEAASGAINDLMRVNPTLLISTLDQLEEAKRHALLRDTVGFNGDAAAIKSFSAQADAEPAHPTSVTWHSLVKACEPALASVLPCGAR